MAKRLIIISCIFIVACVEVNGQSEDSIKTKELENVIINAYEHSQQIKDIPAAVNYIGTPALERFGPVSVVAAINSTPGVRMEERSPGSYRFNIRGSSLRSPFGVRNVKVYFNDIPITDPGGHTYLNQLGYYNFNSIEIIKGPGSSIYGAGTGGVLLIESIKSKETPGVFSEYATGSFGLQNIYGSVQFANNKIGFQHQQSDGYRAHSELKRNVFAWNGRYVLNEKIKLKTTFLYGDLFYETPGALTRVEYDADPRSARPGNAFFPGAEAARASISQKQFIAGLSLENHLLTNLQNKTILYGMFTELRNPTIQNYGRSSEPHAGGRTVFKYNHSMGNSTLTIDAGAETQIGFTSVSIYKNNGGNADSLRTFDEINNRQSLVFVQASLRHNTWTITAGSSLNFLDVKFERFAPASLGKQKRKFNRELAPRFALMKKLGSFNIYTSISKGFSPPTTAELLPTGGASNFDLDAEEGINYDLGIKGQFGNLFVDVNGFMFTLQNTIVQRRTAGGGDFFTNAGKTRQRGIETYLSYPLLQKVTSINRSIIWLSHTFHNFKYKDFKQLNNDFSGNQLPATASHTISTGIDLAMKNGIIATANYYYSDKLPLNDANLDYANAYHLLGLKLGYEKLIRQKFRIKVFAGAENILDENYSLGNDVNGFGGRYYNAAPGRNYYAAVIFQWIARSAQ